MRKTPPQLCVFTCKDGWFSFWAWVDLGNLRMSPHMKSLWRGALPQNSIELQNCTCTIARMSGSPFKNTLVCAVKEYFLTWRFFGGLVFLLGVGRFLKQKNVFSSAVSLEQPFSNWQVGNRTPVTLQLQINQFIKNHSASISEILKFATIWRSK